MIILVMIIRPFRESISNRGRGWDEERGGGQERGYINANEREAREHGKWREYAS